MLGTNRNTNAAGWAILIWQIVQLVVPHFLPAAGVDPSTNIAVTGLISAAGHFSAKDKEVTGAGATATRQP